MFDPKTPEEEESFGFDFTGLLADGETISTAQVTIHVKSGEDPDPMAMLGGTPVVNGPLVSVLLIGGIAGVIYCVTCHASTSNQQKLGLTSDLLVRQHC